MVMRYHVVPHPRGWAIQRSASGRASLVFATKVDAVLRGRELAAAADCELIVHDGNGVAEPPNRNGHHEPPRDGRPPDEP